MRWPGRTIWDTRVQTVCGVLSARGEDGVEVYASATFAQVSLSPPRIVVNPNRTYAVEPAVRASGRFAVSVLPASERDLMIRLMRARRRQPRKVEALALRIREDETHKIPFLEGAMRVVFCEVEEAIESGDRQLYVSRVLESRPNPALAGQRPLLFAEVAGEPPRFPNLRRRLRTALVVTGALDSAKKVLHRLRPPQPADIARATYEMAGATEAEMEEILRPGVTDRSRVLTPPGPAVVRRQLGVCVVGTGWGSFHCRLVREASPEARLFVCGRNVEKTARLAGAVGAEGYFVGLEAALADSRVDALTLALPHDVHREAVEAVAAAGKHSLVEKPIATTLEDADAMIAAAARAGTILMVAEDMHFRPAIAEAVRRTELGDVGEPLYMLAVAGGINRPRGWAADRDRMGGGVLIDIGVHYVRGLRLLMGEPDAVFASRAMQVDTKISGEDSVQLVFSSRAGWEAHMLLSWATQRGHMPDIVVAGDRGTIHLWPGAGYVDYYPVEPPLLPRMISYVRPYWLQEKLMRPRLGRVRIRVPGGEGTGYVAEVREFLSAVSENRPPVTPPADGRRDLEIVLRCYESLARGARTEIGPA